MSSDIFQRIVPWVARALLIAGLIVLFSDHPYARNRPVKELANAAAVHHDGTSSTPRRATSSVSPGST